MTSFFLSGVRKCLVHGPKGTNEPPRKAHVITDVRLSDVLDPQGRLIVKRINHNRQERSNAPLIGYIVQFEGEPEIHPEMIDDWNVELLQ